MRIIVCIKQVPGTTQVEVDEETGVLRRDGVDAKLNPYDLYAIEMALLLRETYGGSVTALTMGPPQARDVLLEAVWMGADDGVLVSDRRFAGADVLATAYTLSQAVRAAGDFDLILCGKQTTDGDTAQVGAELAEFLNLAHAAGVTAIKAEDDTLIVTTNLEHAVITQRMPLPCLLCTDGDINTPRLPSYKRKRALMQLPLRTLSLDDFSDREERHYGLAGSPTRVEKIFPPPAGNDRETLIGPEPELAARLAAILRERKFI